MRARFFLTIFTFGALFLFPLGAQTSAPLPEGVNAVWDTAKAFREATPARERVCLNGLWRWQPAEPGSEQVPAREWGWFKVPGCWPGITDYMQKDSQTIHAHPAWKDRKFSGLSAAWYQREMTIPAGWTGRRIEMETEYLNSYAAVFVDGRKAGEIRFPAGRIDLSAACPPGSTHVLSLLVVALPMKGVMLSYTDSASAREVQGSVPRRGLCGDVFLTGIPAGPRLTGVKVETLVERKEISVSAEVENISADSVCRLRANVKRDGKSVKEFTGPPFRAKDLRDGRVSWTEKWIPEALWDIHTPGNLFTLELSLLGDSGKVLDTFWTSRFGFREFRIEGRDFILNGIPVHLSAVPLDNAQISTATATYEAACETMRRLKSTGINFVYTHNYDCEPGSHLSFTEILRAADDTGMLVALTQPHFSGYDWKQPGADASNGYARDAAFYARVAGNHPSVVMYSTSHNATGYEEDMNPDMIDGVHGPRDQWCANNVKLALRAEAIINRFDPARIVYHHASGNLGPMHDMNFYPNMVPVQEMSDWFGHWSEEGVKPVFMCEYGAPFTWDFTMYRGWYRGRREFGSAKVPWEFCLTEWNSQLFGDRAYAISDAEKTNLRWEAQQFRAGNLWHRWDYPVQVSSNRFTERYPFLAAYINDNWRAFRGWGVSGVSPWEYEHYWKLRDGVNRGREDFKTDWQNLQSPGFSPDYVDQRYERMDIAYKAGDWEATPAAEALVRNNRPLLGFIAGGPEHFTGKGHNYFSGETVRKQLLAVNDSRESVRCSYSLHVPPAFKLSSPSALSADVPAGLRMSWPVTFVLSAEPGKYELKADFKFPGSDPQTDSVTVDVLPRPAPAKVAARIALFDPKGETGALLQKAGVKAEPVDAATDLSSFDILITGKAALTPDSPAPDIRRVLDGLKVILFEQTSAVLEKRFGFRTAEYGLRQVFPRIPDHPILAALTETHLHDWRGAATILPPALAYELKPQLGPTVQWCGLTVPRLWRCGNYGNVASVLIEKPACGDFLSILDGGFGLQYSTLLEYREGNGMMIFCQTDVTARTESDPAAEILTHNLLEYVAGWKAPARRDAIYAGDPAGKRHLERTGITLKDYKDGKLESGDVLIAGHGSGLPSSKEAVAIRGFLENGGRLLAMGFDQADSDSLLPLTVSFKSGEHIASHFPPPGMDSPFAGIGPAEVHNRDPREIPLVRSGAEIAGGGILAFFRKPAVTFCQWVPWQLDPSRSPNVKRTFRRASALLSRLLGNLGVHSSTPLLDRFRQPVAATDKRWLSGLYLDQPEEWDDPYRFFRW